MVEVVCRGLRERVHAGETVAEEVGRVEVEVLSVVVQGEEASLVGLFVLRLRQRRGGGGGGAAAGAGADADVLYGAAWLLRIWLDDHILVVPVIVVVDVEVVVVVVDEVVERVSVEFLVLGHARCGAIDSGAGSAALPGKLPPASPTLLSTLCRPASVHLCSDGGCQGAGRPRSNGPPRNPRRSTRCVDRRKIRSRTRMSRAHGGTHHSGLCSACRPWTHHGARAYRATAAHAPAVSPRADPCSPPVPPRESYVCGHRPSVHTEPPAI